VRKFDNTRIMLTISYTNEIPPSAPSCLQLYNIIFKRSSTKCGSDTNSVLYENFESISFTFYFVGVQVFSVFISIVSYSCLSYTYISSGCETINFLNCINRIDYLFNHVLITF